MLIQYIAGGYINPPLPMVREINRCKHDATTPSGFACHPSTGGELAVRYFFNSPKVLHDVTPLDLLAQVAVLSDGVVAECLQRHSARTLKKHRHW